MDTVLVTGATGFIGSRLVRALIERGDRVRALSRRENPEPPPDFDERGDPLAHERVEVVRGDITDRESLERAAAGCRRVYHLAAYAKNWARDRQTYIDLNVRGMHNVFDAAEKQGVERVVWTSTQLTLGPMPRDVVADEQTPRRAERFLTDYEATKTQAEREAIERAKGGFPVVIVNPARVFGPGHLTEGNSLSKLIDDYDRGKVPILLNRGVNVGNYVLVDDVVEGHVLAMEKGRIGERYILGGENATLKEFFRTIDRVSGRRHFQLPLLKLAPLVFAYMQKKRADWFGTYPLITPGWVRTFATDWAVRCDKAEQELGYQPTPLAEAVRITYEWLLRVREASR